MKTKLTAPSRKIEKPAISMGDFNFPIKKMQEKCLLTIDEQ